MSRLIPKLRQLHTLAMPAAIKAVDSNLCPKSTHIGISYQVFADNGVLWSDNGML